MCYKTYIQLQPHLALKQDFFLEIEFANKKSFAHYYLNGTLWTFVVPIEADIKQLPWRVIFGNPAYGKNWLSQYVLKVAPLLYTFFALIGTL